ncbi:MAG: alpha/beta hydrolase [Phycisphaerales bacterium]|nr:alpha/beta hydrolase [Phycisphaerales bacterium]
MVVTGPISLAFVSLATTTYLFAADLQSDLPYESPGSTSAVLDVYRPDDGLQPGVPTILFIHGGAWYAGDKTDSPDFLTALADAGYGVVSGNYTRSSPEFSSYPQAVHDVKAIVKWIRTVGSELGLSPTVISTGPSAGGHLTMLLSTSSGIEVFEPLAPPPGGYDIQAAIPFWGLSDLVTQANDMGSSGPLAWFLGDIYDADCHDLYVEASPITWVSTDDPPIHLAHGLLDHLHPWRQSLELQQAMQSLDIHASAEYFVGGHGFEEYGGEWVAAAMVIDMIPELLAQGRTPDIDRDHDIDVDDLLVMLSNWSTCPELPADCPADLDGDGTVGLPDLMQLLNDFGSR